MEHKLREYIFTLRAKANYRLANVWCDNDLTLACEQNTIADELEEMLPKVQTEEEKAIGY